MEVNTGVPGFCPKYLLIQTKLCIGLMRKMFLVNITSVNRDTITRWENRLGVRSKGYCYGYVE